MGKPIVRVGDVNSGGGRVISGANSVRINGLPVALDGSPVTAHTDYKGLHNNAQCRASQSTLRVEGKRVIFVGDVDTCGHVRQQGSPSVGQ
jgi:uncharacterized Zn-binding protein involved in type VI secretion